MLAGYTWSHTLDNVDPDTTSQNPNDTNFTRRQEYGPAIYDQRQRFVLSGVYIIPVVKVHFGGVGTFGSGLPYNIVTGTSNIGDTGGTTDRPVIDGAVVGRNAGRGNGQYSVDPFVSRASRSIGIEQSSIYAPKLSTYSTTPILSAIAEHMATATIPAWDSEAPSPASRHNYRHARCSFWQR
ncbi:MAG TPA: hypothetical protein VHZ55_05340 [Bryobacteraceae bacterium]|nr:hypothetical protein [Bryobacteraceae bacterium]